MYSQQSAANEFGNLWAQGYENREPVIGSAGSIGISPALLAILAQVAAAVLPMLLERCSAKSIHRKAQRPWVANSDRSTVHKAIRKQMGFWRFHWYGGSRLVDGAIKAAAAPGALEVMEAAA